MGLQTRRTLGMEYACCWCIACIYRGNRYTLLYRLYYIYPSAACVLFDRTLCAWLGAYLSPLKRKIKKAITMATHGYGFAIVKAKKSFGFALPLETVTTL